MDTKEEKYFERCVEILSPLLKSSRKDIENGLLKLIVIFADVEFETCACDKERAFRTLVVDDEWEYPYRCSDCARPICELCVSKQRPFWRRLRRIWCPGGCALTNQ